ncbi:NADPH:quinone reductase-like Zn-dependent oxidoreductase [Tamaricihabitans halophyticus]|uniref:NADPH:quinone reductase-like Zn-dependent oxidoreductase n=1 Tax=Tamaricihabitans halophyticus TaxID=1262583 RepID=A0A4R2R3K1_9PSEU|nr:zinc-binding dehydrogenase [Tamaricihabitans halophyticus]TCP56289.1 NADPH:quinone reductase-like Zn-dependent oxidoreductase [Tamaricihabitans halophyticus]
MRGVQLIGFGGPEKLVYREDLPDPVPAAGEVRLRVGATALNNTDIWTRQGAYGSATDAASVTGWRRESLSFPRIQGADIVGRIDQVGAGVPAERIGDRVLVDPMIYQGGERELVRTDYLGSERDGGFAELVTVPAENAYQVTSELSDAQLATFPTAYTTAMRMLNRAGLQVGETVLVTGASGGVGSALLQLASLRGADVLAVTTARKGARALRLGARAVLDRAQLQGDAAAFSAAVRAALGGRELDVVADVVGGAAVSRLLGLLGGLGRYVVAGAMAGPVVHADLRTIYLNQLSVFGSSFGTHADFAELVELIAADELTPLLAETFPLRELGRAQEEFMAKEFFGKLVVVPGT